MNSGVFSLPWLLPAPFDFKIRARVAFAAPLPDPPEIRKLGAFALDLTNLEIMGRIVEKHGAALIRDTGLTPFRLGIASSHTMDYVARALPGTAVRHNLIVHVHLARLRYDPMQLLIPDSELGGERPDAVLVALDYRVLGLADAQFNTQEADKAVLRAIDHVNELAAAVRAIGATCILQTLVPPAGPLYGSLDGRVPGSARAMIERFNERLVHEVAREDDLVLDIAFLASAVGLSAWNHARDWNKAKLPCALDSTPLYADHICRLLCAARGRARKCLVLDLDDILWGGAIDRDGLEGIRVGQGSSVGEAHLAFQRYLLNLRRRGVILAVSSFNAEDRALLPFRSHPGMVLRENDIELFFANSTNPAANIQAIALTLKIGTDAIVFIDRNPMQRAMVRETLPEVAVPEIATDPADYPDILSTAGYFEAARFSPKDAGEDRSDRSDFEAARFGTTATVSSFNPASRTGIVRFISAHQNGRASGPCSEREVEQLEEAPDRFCLQISLADQRRDYGIVSVVIFGRKSEAWQCELWLVNADRHSGTVETLALSTVAQAASRAGASRLTVLGTPAGVAAERSFVQLGFSPVSATSGERTEWTLDLSTYQPPPLPFAVIRPN